MWPVRRSEAVRFIAKRHRHAVRPGALFRLGIVRATDMELLAVAIVGKPQAWVSRDPRCAEVLRVCTDESCPEALWPLYRAIGQAAKGMGYRPLITNGEHGRDTPELAEVGWELHGAAEILKYPDAAEASGVSLAPRWLWCCHEG